MISTIGKKFNVVKYINKYKYSPDLCQDYIYYIIWFT